MPKLSIIDYGLGNLRSVEKAVEKVGGIPRITREPADLEEADGLILPGVGAFRDAQTNLKLLEPAVLEQIEAGKPLLGICLGLQLLFTESTEGGTFSGLNVFKGRVVRLPKGLKVPHMGWNTLINLKKSPLVEGLKSGVYVYFVHSYYGLAKDYSDIVAETEYEVTFPSIVSRGNVYATQFHPEKSGLTGFIILKNFIGIVKR